MLLNLEADDYFDFSTLFAKQKDAFNMRRVGWSLIQLRAVASHQEGHFPLVDDLDRSSLPFKGSPRVSASFSEKAPFSSPLGSWRPFHAHAFRSRCRRLFLPEYEPTQRSRECNLLVICKETETEGPKKS